jgi:hypothetical protein
MSWRMILLFASSLHMTQSGKIRKRGQHPLPETVVATMASRLSLSDDSTYRMLISLQSEYGERFHGSRHHPQSL